MNNKHPKLKRTLDQILEILWREWDPIGVNDVPDTRDEYDSYVGVVYWLLKAKAPEVLIQSYLYYVESVLMGLSKPGLKIKRTIKKLKAIHFESE